MSGLQQNHIANVRSREIAQAETQAQEAREQAETYTLERVDTISKNARTLWFGLLGVLVFAGITLLGIEDIDFFGINRNTELPLIGVSVPVTGFFWAGATLTTAIYIYFHMYLLQLWEVLGEAPSHSGDRPLDKVVHPWLVSDAMIRWRSMMRGDDSATPRVLAWVGMVITALLVWCFGLIVLGLFWRLSMAAHNEWMTLWLFVLLFFALVVTHASICVAYCSLCDANEVTLKGHRLVWIGWFFVFVMGAGISWLRTEVELAGYVARVNLIEKHIVKLPADWRERSHAKKWFRANWCRREGIKIVDGNKAPCKGLLPYQQTQFDEEWRSHRQTYLDTLISPNLRNRDLREARLNYGFLPNVDLRGARLERAVLIGAQMEGVDLRGARLEGAVLIGAQMEGANLKGAHMEGADMRGTRLAGADLGEAWLDGVWLTGLANEPNLLIYTRFNVKSAAGLALKFVDMTDVSDIAQAQISAMFGDASVTLPKGMNRPCHWAKQDLETSGVLAVVLPKQNDPYIGRWRGWVEANGGGWPTSERFSLFTDVVAIAPPKNCPLIKDMN